MKIIELNIIQFGKFKDATFTFEDGFNIVRGDNESGKSTLLAFIKFALYGLGRKNPNVLVGERERAISWNAGIAAGSLTIEDVDGKRYRIERAGREGARGTYVDRARIIDLESGKEVLEGEVPGEHFLGINAHAYDSMCNIRQLEAVAVGTDAVKGAIDNLLSSGDENVSIQIALKTLDAERRRLMHTNNKGGLVYESEMALDRLKSEHRGAVVLENERIKNADELDHVELALTKAREEHNFAQKMCDIYDDALRLDKFDKLRELKQETIETSNELNVFEMQADFDTNSANYEKIAQIKSACESLSRSELAFNLAENELKQAQENVEKLGNVNEKGFGEVIEEFGSPNGAIIHLASKKKKRSNSALALTLFGVAGGVMIALALTLALLMKNMFGALTLGFIGVALGVFSVLFYNKFKSAKDEIDAFMKKLGSGFCPKDEGGILEALEKFYESRNLRTSRTNALESARFRFGLAENNLENDRDIVRNLANVLGIKAEGNEKAELLLLCEKIKNYIEKRTDIESVLREKKTLIGALETELERYSENDLRARITPQIRERMANVSFEKLKIERDSALQRTNQLSQYKAGIERNLAAHGTRRSANDIFPEIEAEQERLNALKLRLDAVRLAMETINYASMNMKSDITPRIRENAQKNLAVVTGGKYNELYIDENMSLSIFADGATRPIDSLSKGSLDVAYFSVRLALLQTLLKDKEPPLYMDECLSQLDDGRAENTLKVIGEYSNNLQCILFTCQKRDVELAKKIASVNVVEL